MKIRVDDLQGMEIAQLLEQHLQEMATTSLPKSKHALDLESLRRSEITFWTIWSDQTLAGCIALKQLSPTHGEIKSMRTAEAFRRQGVAQQLLQHLIDEAYCRGYQRVSLETGSMPYFDAARRLYVRLGFVSCPPFGNYKKDPNSVFMTRLLTAY